MRSTLLKEVNRFKLRCRSLGLCPTRRAQVRNTSHCMISNAYAKHFRGFSRRELLGRVGSAENMALWQRATIHVDVIRPQRRTKHLTRLTTQTRPPPAPPLSYKHDVSASCYVTTRAYASYPLFDAQLARTLGAMGAWW
jgi:hypothetical protein